MFLDESYHYLHKHGVTIRRIDYQEYLHAEGTAAEELHAEGIAAECPHAEAITAKRPREAN